MNGTTQTISIDNFFKDSYRDEYTQEILPGSHLKDAMLDEIDYFNKHVWRVVPLSDAMSHKGAKHHWYAMGVIK